jgi:uncharacterized protein YjbI with pentapeptide repeats
MAADLTPHEGDLEPDEDYEGVLFDGASFTDADAGHCHFLDCSFVSTSFDGGRLRKARFTDVTLRETRFVACDLAETGWQDVTLDGCALSGVQAFSATMRRVVFRGCKLDSVNFRSGALTATVSSTSCRRAPIRCDAPRSSAGRTRRPWARSWHDCRGCIRNVTPAPRCRSGLPAPAWGQRPPPPSMRWCA